MKIALPVSTSKTQFYINQTYVNYINEANMTPVIVTPVNDLTEVVNQCDGLLLPGGIDIDPIYYGYDNLHSENIDPQKDEFERSLFTIFRENNKPTFGICRGLQLIAYEFMNANTNIRDNYIHFQQNIEGHAQVHNQGLRRDVYQHFVEYIPSILYGFGSKKTYRMPVNSMHHQCLLSSASYKLNLLASGLTITAWTDRNVKQSAKLKRIVIEAFTIKNWGGRILAVQWHPEEVNDVDLISNFFTQVVNNGMDSSNMEK